MKLKGGALNDKESDKKLYIPVNVLETKDLVSGIGGKEFVQVGLAAAAGVIISIITYAMKADIIACMIIIAFTTTVAFITVRRDNHNESMIDKLVQIYRYVRAQKRFEYEYMGIKSTWEDET